MRNPTIKIFVSCHKSFPVLDNRLLCPIHVGAALSDERISGYLRDDIGENISHKNRRYCELTGQYWAWKNAAADYYGFFHYRRYLYPDAQAHRPYLLRAEPSEKVLQQLGYDRFSALIEQYDLIAPIGENMYISVRDHYATAPYHHGKDLALVEMILREKYPEYAEAAETYLSETVCYFGNIYIMAQQVFNDYCRWLFDILEEFDRRSDTSGYGTQELRVDGYLAERLFGVYYTHWREKLRCLELPRVHFEPNVLLRCKRKIINALLPPGSERRARMKGSKQQ